MDDESIFVINDDTGQDIGLLECGEELEPIEEIVDFVDTDSQIQYTDDQLAINLLNILSFNDNDILKHKSYWNKRSREFVEIIKALGQVQNINPNLIPIINANKVIVVDDNILNEKKEAGEEDEFRKDLRDESFLEVTTNETILSKRLNLTKTKDTPLPKLNQQLATQERLWISADNMNKYTVDFEVQQDCEGELINPVNDTMMTQLIKPEKKKKIEHEQECVKQRQIRLLGTLMNQYEGDFVKVVGFLYVVDPTYKTLEFDPNAYVNTLNNMVVGEKVIVLSNRDDKHEQGIINDISSNGDLSISTKTDVITVSIKNIETNDCFVYKADLPVENLYCKYKLKNYNVRFDVLTGDKDLTKTISLMLPSTKDLIHMYEDDYRESYTFKEMKSLFDKYGLSLYSLNKNGYEQLTVLLNNNVTQLLSSTKERELRKKRFTTEFKGYSVGQILDFNKHLEKLKNYEEYNFMEKNGRRPFVDNDYHRIKHIMSQGDNGSIYLYEIIAEYCDKLYSYIKSHKTQFEKEYIEVDNIIKELSERLERQKDTEQCPQVDLKVKKEYTDINRLQEDNFKSIQDVKEGDYAKLVLKDKNKSETVIFFKRVLINDSSGVKEFWKKDIEASYNTCTDDKKIPNHTGLLGQKCVYDEVDKLCQTKEYVKLKKTLEYNKMRRSVLQKIEYLFNNYLVIKTQHQEMLQWLKNVIHITHKENLYELQIDNQVDYTDFVGDLDVDDDLKYGEREYGDDIGYDKLTNEKEEKSNKEKSDHWISTFVKYFGIKINSAHVKFIIDLHDHFNSEKEMIYDNLKKILKTIDEKMKQALLNPKNDPKKLATQKDALMKQNEETLRKTYNREAILYVSALYIIAVQLQLPNVELETAYSNCVDVFGTEGYPLNDNKKSLLHYISCILKHMSTNNDERLDAFKLRSVEQIQTQIKEKITKILSKREDITHELKYIAETLTSRDKDHHHIKYNEWDSYRPVVDIKTVQSNYVKYIKLMYDLSKQMSSNEKLQKDATIITTFMKNNTFKELYTSLTSSKKNLSAKAFYETVIIEKKPDLFILKDIAVKHKTVRSSINENDNKNSMKLHINSLQVALENTKNIDFWDTFVDNISSFMSNYYIKRSIGAEFQDDVSRLMFKIDNSNALKLKNTFRQFLFDDVKSFLGKLLNSWKIDSEWIRKRRQLDKKKKEHEKILDILTLDDNIYTICSKLDKHDQFKQVLYNKIHTIIRNTLYSSETFEVKTQDEEEIKRNIYIYDYILSYIIYNITNITNNTVQDFDDYDIDNIPVYSTVTDIVEREKYEIVFDIGKSILELFVKKVKTNSFDAYDISRKFEEMREKYKEDIIKSWNTLAIEDKKAFVEIEKFGIILDKSTGKQIDDNDYNNEEDLKQNRVVDGDNDKEYNYFDELNKLEAEKNLLMRSKGNDPDDDDSDNEGDMMGDYR